MIDFGRYTVGGSRKPRKRRGGRVLPASALRVFVSLPLFCAVILVSGSGIFEAPETGRLGDDPRELAERRVLEDRAFNVLVVGVDQGPDGASEEAGARADTLMLARVFPETGEVRLLSVPRDLFIEVSPGYEDRVNAAYAYGGIRQTVKAVESYTGTNIDHYAVVDFEGFESVVDAMGGVRLDVRAGEYPPEWGLEEGSQTLSGEQALFYARFRGMSGGDLDRVERQQEIIAALREQALGLDSVSTLPEVARAAENVRTDLGFRKSVSLGGVLLGSGGGSRMETGKLVGEAATLSDGRQVLIPDDEENRRLIEEFLR